MPRSRIRCLRRRPAKTNRRLQCEETALTWDSDAAAAAGACRRRLCRCGRRGVDQRGRDRGYRDGWLLGVAHARRHGGQRRPAASRGTAAGRTAGAGGSGPHRHLRRHLPRLPARRRRQVGTVQDRPVRRPHLAQLSRPGHHHPQRPGRLGTRNRQELGVGRRRGRHHGGAARRRQVVGRRAARRPRHHVHVERGADERGLPAHGAGPLQGERRDHGGDPDRRPHHPLRVRRPQPVVPERPVRRHPFGVRRAAGPVALLQAVPPGPHQRQDLGGFPERVRSGQHQHPHPHRLQADQVQPGRRGGHGAQPVLLEGGYGRQPVALHRQDAVPDARRPGGGHPEGHRGRGGPGGAQLPGAGEPADAEGQRGRRQLRAARGHWRQLHHRQRDLAELRPQGRGLRPTA